MINQVEHGVQVGLGAPCEFGGAPVLEPGGEELAATPLHDLGGTRGEVS